MLYGHTERPTDGCATLKDAEGLRELVTRYHEGNSVNMDPAEAARLLKLASDMGDGQAVSSPGYTLTTGKGVLVDPQGAKT